MVSQVQKKRWEKQGEKLFCFLVIILFFNLPFVSAMEFSNIRAEDITENSAVIKWNTAEAADSFVHYGLEKESLQSLGDANLLTAHQLPLTNLKLQTNYYFTVESDNAVDDNNGALYSFTTLAPDTTPPELAVQIPSFVAGERLSLSGSAENGAKINLFLNGMQMGSTVAVKVEPEVEPEIPSENTSEISSETSSENENGANTAFSFNDIFLEGNQFNNITIKAADKAGNEAEVNGLVFADTSKPKLKIEPLPEEATGTSLKLNGTVSENCSIEIFVNNRSVSQLEGTIIDVNINLQEGKNEIIIAAKDVAGWETRESYLVNTDTQQPNVKVTIEKGNEYFEGRATSPITGETKAGAKVYLFVYRPLSNQYNPSFEKARAETVADGNGQFKFNEVDFASTLSDVTVKDLALNEVPSNLRDSTIYPIQEIAEQQDLTSTTYYVYVIVKDKAGRVTSWQTTIAVNSCYSSNFDFSFESMPQFQMPLRLVPQLMDEGRQQVQAVFQFKYLGQSLSSSSSSSPSGTPNEMEQGFRMVDAKIEEACTQGMQKDDLFSLGCKLLPRSPTSKIKNSDGTSLYVSWNLNRADELSKRKDNFWDDLKGRKLIFPLKITVSYQERTGENTWGDVKYQTSCYDLGYFIDIPIESKELIPDFLANEGVATLNWTVTQLETSKKYLEEAYFIAGVSCMGSWLLRGVARMGRMLTSFMEGYAKKNIGAGKSGDEEGCPNGVKQYGLYLDSTIENWEELKAAGIENIPLWVGKGKGSTAEENKKKYSLEKRCPNTAMAWKVEAALDQAYKWTCDRAACRSVPAGWTADKKLEDIQRVILKQQQCAVTGRGVPLNKLENCQEKIKVNPFQLSELYVADEMGECWQTADGSLYVKRIPKDDTEEVDEEQKNAKNMFTLMRVGSVFRSQQPIEGKSLLVYQPPGSQDFFVGRNKKCAEICADPRRNAGGKKYAAAEPNFCRPEKVEGDKITVELESNEISAGYTSDCFEPKEDQMGLNQCVCSKKQEKPQVVKDKDYSLRQAEIVPKQEPGINIGAIGIETSPVKEEWFYHQERVFEESFKTKGTYYPPERYYTGRDFSGAFGADYLLDYIGKGETVPRVDPHSGLIGTVQTLCLSGILKNIVMIDSILMGLRNCLVQAKYTGLQDAGMCKTMFTRHVCGLAYQAIAYLAGKCSPFNFDDVSKGDSFGDVGAFISGGFKAMDNSLQTSIDDLKDDYGNAAFTQYFQGGAQGFVQSLCLAAFGIEFPLFSKEFLLESAYAFPMETSVNVFPAERELTAYNPAKKSVIYNYNVGGMILPGCKIRRWTAYLKCIGPEDLDQPDVDPSCLGQRCDCLDVQSSGQSLEGERKKILQSGGGITSGSMFDLPIKSPERIDSSYRYDHLIIELDLDPSEKNNADICFDEKYRQGNKGVFYFPIKDVSPPGEFACKADIITGKYTCPELYSMFGFGGAYFEEPYVTCFNKKTNNWVDCQTPNLFLLKDKDEIRVRVHLNLDDKGKCLKRTIVSSTGAGSEEKLQIADNSPGPLYREESLGLITEEMFSGVSSFIRKALPPESNSNCAELVPENPNTGTGTGGRFEFRFVPGSAPEKVKLIVPPSAYFTDSRYTRTQDYNSYLFDTTNNNVEFTITEINAIKFILNGYVVNNILGSVNPTDASKVCVYTITPGQTTGSSQENVRNLNVEYELYELDEGGLCGYPTVPVKASGGQKTKHQQKIRIQREESAFQEVGGMHQRFIDGSYELTIQLAQGVLQQKSRDLSSVLAVYYYVASLMMLKQKSTQADAYQTEIINLLNLHFNNKYGTETLAPYGTEVTETNEYKKIEKYLCLMGAKVGYQNEKCQS